MTPEQEKAINNHILQLMQRTSNLKALATELLQHGVITLTEREEIIDKQVIEERAKTLFEIVVKKSPVCFKLLLKCLRCSGNENVAKILDEGLGEVKRGKMIYRRSSSTADRYIREDVGNTLIQGREMGIAEIFEEEIAFAKNWKTVFHLLNISDRKLPLIESYSNFAVKVTIMLKDWVDQEKLKGSVANLMKILEKKGYEDTSIRLKRMFEDFSVESETGFLFQFQGAATIPISEAEFVEIARVLEDNPDFALQWEKLFLLLELPLEYFHQFSNLSSFIDNAINMLTLWKRLGNDDPTYFDLARVLVQNGHRSTAVLPAYLFVFQRQFQTFLHSVSKFNPTMNTPCGQLSYLHNPSSTPLLGLTLGQVLDQTNSRYGDRDAVIFCDENIRRTFKELKQEVDSLAAGFLSLGLTRGDKVGLWGRNSYFYYLTQLGIWKAGLTLVSVQPEAQASELLYFIKNAGMKCFVLPRESDYYEKLLKAVPEIESSEPGYLQIDVVPELTTVITMRTSAFSGTLTIHEVMEKGSLERSKELFRTAAKTTQMDDICGIAFTSGTTGNPKGTMLSHHNIVNSSFFIGNKNGYAITETDKLCMTVQLSHAFGITFGAIVGLSYGAPCIFPSQLFNAKTVLATIANEKCTVLFGTPTMYTMILDELNLNDYDLASLRLAICSSSYCPKGLLMRIKERLTVETAMNIYGMTEAGLIFHPLPTDDDDIRSSTVGYPGEHYEVKIVDRHGQILPRGEAGEICVRSYAVTSGYFNNPVKTAELIDSDKWLHTGDAGIMLDSGHALINGRVKDIIIVGGLNIYPKDIEDLLNSHRHISEAHVFGVLDTRLGEEIAVWVKLHKEKTLTELDVKNYCIGQIVFYKIPSYVIFVKDFPKTSSGKVQKNKMRDHERTKRHVEKARALRIGK